MTYEEMLNSLKIKKNTNINFDKHPDLGKFGWGLKTASFSQCNFLIIISKISCKNLFKFHFFFKLFFIIELKKHSILKFLYLYVFSWYF